MNQRAVKRPKYTIHQIFLITKPTYQAQINLLCKSHFPTKHTLSETLSVCLREVQNVIHDYTYSLSFPKAISLVYLVE